MSLPLFDADAFRLHAHFSPCLTLIYACVSHFSSSFFVVLLLVFPLPAAAAVLLLLLMIPGSWMSGTAIEPASSADSSSSSMVTGMMSSSGIDGSSNNSSRILLPVILCIMLICLTMLLAYVAVILCRIREYASDDYPDYYMDRVTAPECEQLNSRIGCGNKNSRHHHHHDWHGNKKKKDKLNEERGSSGGRWGWWPSYWYAHRCRKVVNGSGTENPFLRSFSSSSKEAENQLTGSSFHIPPDPVIHVDDLKVDQLVAKGNFGTCIYRGSLDHAVASGVGQNYEENECETTTGSSVESSDVSVVAIKVYNVMNRTEFERELQVYRLLSMTASRGGAGASNAGEAAGGRKSHPSIPAWFGRLVHREGQSDRVNNNNEFHGKHECDEKQQEKEEEDGGVQGPEIPDVRLDLVISFAPGGRLDSFLELHSIDWVTFCRMSLSIASGIAFLHSNNHFIVRKSNHRRRRIQPSSTSENEDEDDDCHHHQEDHVTTGCVVHRDLSSKNILIKADMSCLICDFGDALILTNDHAVHQQIQHTHAGDCSCCCCCSIDRSDDHHDKDQGANSKIERSSDSLRYLAPELLLLTHDISSIGMDACSWKQVDVYAFSLILWELATRCTDLYQGLPVPNYRKPYEQELASCCTSSGITGDRSSSNSSTRVTMEQMQIIVTKHKSRPLFADVWKESNPAIKSLRETITDSWDEVPEARLTAVCIEQRLSLLPLLWDRHRQDQRLLLQHNIAKVRHVSASTAIDHHHGSPGQQRQNHEHTGNAAPVAADVQRSSHYQQNLIRSSTHLPISLGNGSGKNVNVSSSNGSISNIRSGDASGSGSSVISFPIQPFLGRNPCLQRNLNPEDLSVPGFHQTGPDSCQPVLLQHTMKFRPLHGPNNANNNNNNNWSSSVTNHREVDRVNNDMNVRLLSGSRQQQQQSLRLPAYRQMHSSRPGPIPQAIRNPCLLPKQENQSVVSHSNSGHAPDHNEAGTQQQQEQREHMSQSSSLARRLTDWAVRKMSSFYDRRHHQHLNLHLLPEEVEPFSKQNDSSRSRRRRTCKDSLPRGMQQQGEQLQQLQQQQSPQLHGIHDPSDETIIVIDGNDNNDNEGESGQNTNVIHDKQGTTPKEEGV